MNERVLAYLKMSVAMAIVGSSVVVGKLVIASFPVFLASGLRFVVATAILVPLLLKSEGGWPRLPGRDWRAMLLQSLAGVFLFNLCMLYGLQYTTAVAGGIISSTIPAAVGMIAFLFLKERLGVKKGIGIALTVLGTVVINGLGGAGEPGAKPLLGDLLIFGAVIGEALFITLGKSVSGKISPLAISTLMSVLGLLEFLPFAVAEGVSFHFAGVSWTDWGLILYNGIFVTVVAFFLMYQGIAKVPASTAGVFTGVLPLATVLLSYAVLGESFQWSHLIGMLCVLVGIVLIARDGQGQTEQAVTETTM